MANLLSAFLTLEETIERVIDHLEMDGEVTNYDEFRNCLIHFLFKFHHRYLSVNDTIAFEQRTEIRKILDDVVLHIKEIKFQFNAYFNGIWC